MNTQAKDPRGDLAFIPSEIIRHAISFLANKDLKNLRLTSTYFRDELRLTRAFLSSHPRDIQIFERIAKHVSFSKQVTEIIYDCTSLIDSDERPVAMLLDGDDAVHEAPPPGVPEWFCDEYKKSLTDVRKYLQSSKSYIDHKDVIGRYNTRMSVEEAYKLNRLRAQQQRSCVNYNRHVNALHYGLDRFPNLKKVTLSIVAHGVCFVPNYETPFIRSLPRNFVYPIPRTGPGAYRNEFSKIVKALIENKNHGVTQFVMEDPKPPTGMDSRFLEENDSTYKHFEALVAKPGFSHLDLSIAIYRPAFREWRRDQSPLLRQALAGGEDLQHVSLCTVVGGSQPVANEENGMLAMEDQLITLRQMLPNPDHFKRLRHLGLSGLKVTVGDVFRFLSVLPASLRSVELSFLTFPLEMGGSYGALLCAIKTDCGWSERHASERPTIKVLLEAHGEEPGTSLDVSRDAVGFVYDKAENPFDLVEHAGDNKWKSHGKGIIRYAFVPERAGL